MGTVKIQTLVSQGFHGCTHLSTHPTPDLFSVSVLLSFQESLSVELCRVPPFWTGSLCSVQFSGGHLVWTGAGCLQVICPRTSAFWLLEIQLP